MRFMWDNNFSNEEIANRMDCSVRTVRRWGVKFMDELERNVAHTDRRVNNTHPWKLSDAQLLEIAEEMTENPFQAVRNLPQVYEFNVNERTIRESLRRRAGFRCCNPSVKAEINVNHELARLQYAFRFQGWTAEQWRRTIAVDEKVFSTSTDEHEAKTLWSKLHKKYVQLQYDLGRRRKTYGLLWPRTKEFMKHMDFLRCYCHQTTNMRNKSYDDFEAEAFLAGVPCATCKCSGITCVTRIASTSERRKKQSKMPKEETKTKNAIKSVSEDESNASMWSTRSRTSSDVGRTKLNAYAGYCLYTKVLHSGAFDSLLLTMRWVEQSKLINGHPRQFLEIQIHYYTFLFIIFKQNIPDNIASTKLVISSTAWQRSSSVIFSVALKPTGNSIFRLEPIHNIYGFKEVKISKKSKKNSSRKVPADRCTKFRSDQEDAKFKKITLAQILLQF
ncbi:unnamed protein product [Trichogramma brassicae]|uniref:Transposase Tc1-like domain-containing protein n=1 Tax=Trichogramma brassicae TaxID=86971 RepID=A0A6H5IJM6_9HYME|nr:unnamed protein product [Trichogramma brassicae]